MCQILVKVLDNTHLDPAIDRVWSYKSGDVVAVVPDDHEWGTKELDESVFRIISMPGVPADSMRYLQREHPEAMRQTAALAIPVLRMHIQSAPRPTEIRRRFAVDMQTAQIIDKTRP